MTRTNIEKLVIPYDTEKFLLELIKDDDTPDMAFNRNISVSLDDVVRLHYYRMLLDDVDNDTKVWQGFAVEQMLSFHRDFVCSLSDMLKILDAKDVSDLDGTYATGKSEDLHPSIEQYLSLPADKRSSISAAAWEIVTLTEVVHDNIDPWN